MLRNHRRAIFHIIPIPLHLQLALSVPLLTLGWTTLSLWFISVLFVFNFLILYSQKVVYSQPLIAVAHRLFH